MCGNKGASYRGIVRRWHLRTNWRSSILKSFESNLEWRLDWAKLEKVNNFSKKEMPLKRSNRLAQMALNKRNDF